MDVYVCGHDHTLQHLRHVTGHGLDFVVSGAGGALLYARNPANELDLMQVCQLSVMLVSLRVHV